MIRRLLIALAVIGIAGAFASSIRDLYRFADRYCGEAEGGGNCRAIAHYFATNDIVMFLIFSTALAILIVFPKLRSARK